MRIEQLLKSGKLREGDLLICKGQLAHVHNIFGGEGSKTVVIKFRHRAPSGADYIYYPGMALPSPGELVLDNHADTLRQRCERLAPEPEFDFVWHEGRYYRISHIDDEGTLMAVPLSELRATALHPETDYTSTIELDLNSVFEDLRLVRGPLSSQRIGWRIKLGGYRAGDYIIYDHGTLYEILKVWPGEILVRDVVEDVGMRFCADKPMPGLQLFYRDEPFLQKYGTPEAEKSGSRAPGPDKTEPPSKDGCAEKSEPNLLPDLEAAVAAEETVNRGMIRAFEYGRKFLYIDGVRFELVDGRWTREPGWYKEVDEEVDEVNPFNDEEVNPRQLDQPSPPQWAIDLLKSFNATIVEKQRGTEGEVDEEIPEIEDMDLDGQLTAILEGLDIFKERIDKLEDGLAYLRGADAGCTHSQRKFKEKVTGDLDQLYARVNDHGLGLASVKGETENLRDRTAQIEALTDHIDNRLQSVERVHHRVTKVESAAEENQTEIRDLSAQLKALHKIRIQRNDVVNSTINDISRRLKVVDDTVAAQDGRITGLYERIIRAEDNIRCCERDTDVDGNCDTHTETFRRARAERVQTALNELEQSIKDVEKRLTGKIQLVDDFAAYVSVKCDYRGGSPSGSWSWPLS